MPAPRVHGKQDPGAAYQSDPAWLRLVLGLGAEAGAEAGVAAGAGGGVAGGRGGGRCAVPVMVPAGRSTASWIQQLHRRGVKAAARGHKSRLHARGGHYGAGRRCREAISECLSRTCLLFEALRLGIGVLGRVGDSVTRGKRLTQRRQVPQHPGYISRPAWVCCKQCRLRYQVPSLAARTVQSFTD